jgi:cell division protease FtsH
MPVEDRYTVTQSELLGRIDVLMGGRIAELMVSGEFSTGAANDLTKATDIARKMIIDYGMSERFKNVALTSRGMRMPGEAPSQESLFHREYSEATQQYIDEEIASIVEKRYAKVTEILNRNRALLDTVATRLLEKETLEEKEFKALVEAGPQSFSSAF